MRWLPSRKQRVTKDAITGRYESPANKGPEDYSTDEVHRSPWRKAADEMLDQIEAEAFVGTNEALRQMDSWTVALMVHAQGLKRVDR